MLYDQAQLLSASLEAALLVPANKPEIRKELQQFASDIIDYVERDLTHPEGGFYAAEDADSYPTREATKKVEGAFYVWQRDELDAILGADAALFAHHYGVASTGNVPTELDAHDELKGKVRVSATAALWAVHSPQNVLAVQSTIEDTAKHIGVSAKEVARRLGVSLDVLKAHRDANRPRPALDDKVVAAWNGLMLSALAKAAEHPWDTAIQSRALGLSQRAVAFLRAHLYVDGQLYRSWRGERGPLGQCEDYALVAQGVLDLYEATGDDSLAVLALELQHKQDDLFLDRQHGGYYCSRADDATLLVRTMPTLALLG